MSVNAMQAGAPAPRRSRATSVRRKGSGHNHTLPAGIGAESASLGGVS
jgi:hypothetical protein